jgi:glycosyltransferase involved in cell wall biosynthesis
MQHRSPQSEIDRIDCVVVVPAFNEVARIGRCLSSIAISNLPDGYKLSEIVVADGASTDGTVTEVQRWSGENPGLHITISTSSLRRGKAGDLGNFHTSELLKMSDDEIVVICDADVAVRPGSLRALLESFTQKPSIAVAFGADFPDNCQRGRWASSFQMSAVTAFGKAAGDAVPRAYGRFFAYRIAALKDFTWSPDRGPDDLQLLVFIESNSISCRSVWSATVDVTPAGNYRDFYYQTARGRLAAARTKAGKTSIRSRLAPFRTAAEHPHWAVAYCAARLASIVQRVFSPTKFENVWVPPSSTKTPLS